MPAFSAGMADTEIVVTARRLDPPKSDTAYDIITIDRGRLANSASGRLEDILRDAAGFQQFRRSDARSAHPTSQGTTLRGLGGNASSRALILLDGIPQIDPFGGWVNWTSLAPTRLGEVRVTRGGGSGVYGSGALAGTIELESARPGQVSPLWGDVSYGSRNSVDSNTGLSAKIGGGFVSLSGSYARGDGFVPIVSSQRGPVDQAAPYEQASIDARAVMPVGAKTELQANVLGSLDERTRGTSFTPNRNVGVDASLGFVGHGHWGWEALGYVQRRKFSSGFASINAARTIATQSLDQYNVPATGFGGRFELRPSVGRALQLRAGLDGRTTSGRTDEFFSYVAGAPTRNRRAGGHSATLGTFADASLTPSDALTLTLGGRIDRWWIDDGILREYTIASGAILTNSQFPNRAGWKPTGRAGVAWTPVSTITLRAATYLGWRLPTLNELYRPFRVGTDATAANAALNPERLSGVDGGIEFRPIKSTRLGVTAFWNKLEDAIANATLGKGPGTFPGVGFVAAGGTFRQRQNLDAIRSRGVELDAGIDLKPWSLSASYAFVEARVEASGIAAQLNGLRPAETPQHQASATFAYAGYSGVHGSFTLRYISGQFDDDLNTRELKDAITMDAALTVPIRHGFALTLRAENLADKPVQAANTNGLIERATPRTLWIGLRYEGPG